MPIFAGRGFFLALPVAGHAGAPPIHYAAGLGPGQAPWRVIWTSKVARADFLARNRVPPRRAEKDHGNPTRYSCFFYFRSAAVSALPHHLQKAL